MDKVFGNIPIYWINLEKSKFRKQTMETLFKGTNNKRIVAVDGVDPVLCSKKYKIIGGHPVFSTALNAVLCSHVKAIYTAYHNNLEYVVVLEDRYSYDAGNFPFTIFDVINLAKNTDPDNDVVLLINTDHETSLHNGYPDIPKMPLYITKKDHFMAGLIYLINRKGMKKILDLVTTNGVNYFDITNLTSKYYPFESMFYDHLNAYVVHRSMFKVHISDFTFKNYYADQKLNETFCSSRVLEKN